MTGYSASKPRLTASPEPLGGTYEQQYNLITNKEEFLKVCKVFKKKVKYAIQNNQKTSGDNQQRN